MITSSIAGRRALKGSLYSATKFAVTGMAEAARQDFNGTGVRTTLISPGMVETRVSAIRRTTLVADDIARAVLFAVAQPPHMDVNEILIRPTGAGGVVSLCPFIAATSSAAGRQFATSARACAWA